MKMPLQCWVPLFALWVSLGGLADASVARAALVPGNDSADTREFTGLAAELRNQDGEAERQRVLPYQIVFVPGLITDVTEEVGRFTRAAHITPTPGFLAAFYQQKLWLERSGISFTVAPINRSGSCDDNADVIAQAVADSPRPVILVTQSKGGVDVLTALIRHPAMRAQVAGWVAYQPPHDGSILADLIETHAPLRGPTDALLGLLKGSALAIGDMSTAARARFHAAHAEEIAAVAREIPIVTLVTSQDPAGLGTYLFRPSHAAFLGPFIDVIAQRDTGLNDGIASMHGTCLEGGSACVYLTGIDHFDAVMNTAPYQSISEADRVSLFRGLLGMLARRLGR